MVLFEKKLLVFQILTLSLKKLCSMKLKLFTAVLILLGFTAPQFVNAQANDKAPIASPPESVKGPHGGMIIGSDNIRFEMVDNGTTVCYYPVNKSGQISNSVPTVATCTIVYADLSQHYQQTNVQLTNGCFTITPPRDYPMYLYAIETSFNGAPIVAKYALPIKTK